MNLILRRELMCTPRRRRFHLKRAGLAALGGAVILYGLSMGSLAQTTTFGLQVFRSLAFSSLVVLSLAAAVNASSLIMREKEERTLGLLFLSGVTPWGFLLGKVAASVFSLLLAMLSLLPMFMLAVSLGGVSAAQILGAYAVLFCCVFLVACAGMFCATVCRSESPMNSLLALLCMTYFAALPIALVMNFELRETSMPDELMIAVSPFAAMAKVTDGDVAEACATACPVMLVIALPLLLAARALLPRSVTARDRPAPARSLREAAQRWVRRSANVGRRRIGAARNAVAAKDIAYWHGGRKGILVKFAVSTLGLAAIVLGVYTAVEWDEFKADQAADAVLWALLCGSLALTGLALAANCGAAFSREKRNRTIEVLLTTVLTDREIITGKLAAAALSVLPWAVCAAASGLTLCAMHVTPADVDDMLAAVAMVTAEALTMCYGYGCLALLVSLRFRRNFALPVCVLVAMTWHSGVKNMLMLFPMLLLREANAFGWLGLTPYLTAFLWVGLDAVFNLALGIVCLRIVFAKFRPFALRE